MLRPAVCLPSLVVQWIFSFSYYAWLWNWLVTRSQINQLTWCSRGLCSKTQLFPTEIPRSLKGTENFRIAVKITANDTSDHKNYNFVEFDHSLLCPSQTHLVGVGWRGYQSQYMLPGECAVSVTAVAAAASSACSTGRCDSAGQRRGTCPSASVLPPCCPCSRTCPEGRRCALGDSVKQKRGLQIKRNNDWDVFSTVWSSVHLHHDIFRALVFFYKEMNSLQ